MDKKSELSTNNVDGYLDNFSINAGIEPGELGIFTENGLIPPLSREEKPVKIESLKEDF